MTLIPGQRSYTWGVVPGEATPAGIPHPAPVRLEICLLNIGGSPAQEWPIHILTQEEYEHDVWFKLLDGSYPECVYLEDAQPYNVLYVYPVPTVAHSLALLPWQAHSPYAGWDAVLDWPNGIRQDHDLQIGL